VHSVHDFILGEEFVFLLKKGLRANPASGKLKFRIFIVGLLLSYLCKRGY